MDQKQKAQIFLGLFFIIASGMGFIMILALDWEKQQEPQIPTGYFTLIDPRLEIRFGKLAVNQPVTIYALDLSGIDVYMVNISENNQNDSLSWLACFFVADTGDYTINYLFSNYFVNCTYLSIELWTNSNWELSCSGITGYSPNRDVLLDEILLLV